MTDATFSDQVFVAIQKILPTRALSSAMHKLTRIKNVRFKNAFIRSFIWLFKITLDETVVRDPSQFKSFNEFFTRALKPGARIVDASAKAFVSPVDGTVSQFGDLSNGELIQAKGHSYSAQTLLAGRADWAEEFTGGQFITIYLAPDNYHRIHMPVRGTLREWAYVPGRLFSVNHATARALPGVFAKNERVVAMFDTELGPLAMVLVGALFVGSMETVWAGEISPPHSRDSEPRLYGQTDPITLEKGMEMGRFNMGSTVILLTQQKLNWAALLPKHTLRMGEKIASLK